MSKQACSQAPGQLRGSEQLRRTGSSQIPIRWHSGELDTLRRSKGPSPSITMMLVTTDHSIKDPETPYFLYHLIKDPETLPCFLSHFSASVYNVSFPWEVAVSLTSHHLIGPK